MAGSVGKICTPHISGNGVGYLYMLHFVAACPNAGPYHEFKGFAKDLPLEAPKEITTSMSGSVQVPMQAGLGVKLDPGFVAKHKVIT
jgi:L-alanine-DL-glutamate epimerase-like enolase superfamily enzyme